MTEAEVQAKIVNKLKRKYGDANVHEPAGAQEYGIDVIFIKTDGNEFDDPLVVGLQIKSEPTLAASSVQKAIGQITVGVSHPFIVGGSMDGVTVDIVYILNYGEINQAAREYLAAARRTLKNLKWLDKSSIDPYILDEVSTSDFDTENPNE